MLLSAVSVLDVAQSSSEIPEGLMNNPVLCVQVQGAAWLKRSGNLGNRGLELLNGHYVSCTGRLQIERIRNTFLFDTVLFMFRLRVGVV